MSNVKTSGPKVGPGVFYIDAVYGKIAAMITAVNATTGSVSLTTFPPGAVPAFQTGINYDANGTIVGDWHYGIVEYF